MGEEIVTKVINRKSYLTSEYKQNGHLGSQNLLNLHRSSLFKKTSIKSCMTSTPKKFRRKTIDNSECETVTQRKWRQKTYRDSNDPIENITPVKSQKTKHGFGLVKGIASLNGRTNVCNNMHDITAFSSPTQSRMLSLNESMLEAVDLDSAVKDYWDSQNRNLNLGIHSVEHEDRCGSPDLFEGVGNINDDEVINSIQQSSAADSCKVITQCSKIQCDVGNPSSKIVYKHVTDDSKYKDPHAGISLGQNSNVQSVDVAWENDSFFEDAICFIDKDLPTSNSLTLSNLPLGEKIKRTLITNVQKPVTPKPRSVQVNAGHVLQNSSSVMDKLSTHPDSGPFFGLPVKVKSLIQKFKGISDLYRKFCM
jgi:hypothetical protein